MGIVEFINVVISLPLHIAKEAKLSFSIIRKSELWRNIKLCVFPLQRLFSGTSASTGRSKMKTPGKVENAIYILLQSRLPAG